MKFLISCLMLFAGLASADTFLDPGLGSDYLAQYNSCGSRSLNEYAAGFWSDEVVLTIVDAKAVCKSRRKSTTYQACWAVFFDTAGAIQFQMPLADCVSYPVDPTAVFELNGATLYTQKDAAGYRAYLNSPAAPADPLTFTDFGTLSYPPNAYVYVPIEVTNTSDHALIVTGFGVYANSDGILVGEVSPPLSGKYCHWALRVELVPGESCGGRIYAYTYESGPEQRQIAEQVNWEVLPDQAGDVLTVQNLLVLH